MWSCVSLLVSSNYCAAFPGWWIPPVSPGVMCYDSRRSCPHLGLTSLPPFHFPQGFMSNQHHRPQPRCNRVSGGDTGPSPTFVARWDKAKLESILVCVFPSLMYLAILRKKAVKCSSSYQFYHKFRTSVLSNMQSMIDERTNFPELGHQESPAWWTWFWGVRKGFPKVVCEDSTWALLLHHTLCLLLWVPQNVFVPQSRTTSFKLKRSKDSL